eukprot:1507662-Rhodomonas_salina.2
MSGTDLAYEATRGAKGVLQVASRLSCYAMSGTGIGYRATHLLCAARYCALSVGTVVVYHVLLSLCNVRYGNGICWYQAAARRAVAAEGWWKRQEGGALLQSVVLRTMHMRYSYPPTVLYIC